MKFLRSVFFRISIAFGLLIFLFVKTDRTALGAALGAADPVELGIAFVLLFLLNMLVLARWQVLLNGTRIRIGWGRVFGAYMSALFFNLFLPSTVGGDAVRTLDVAAVTGRSSSEVLATVVLDRVAGFLGLVTVLVVALFFGYRLFGDPSILIATFILFFGAVVFSFFLFSTRFFRGAIGWVPWERIRHYLGQVHEATRAYRGRRSCLVAVWVISVFTHAGLGVVFYLTARALGDGTGLMTFIIFVPMVVAFSSLPFSIGGLGLRDAAAIAVFTRVGMPREVALAMSLVHFAMTLALGVLGGACHVLAFHRRRI